METPLSKNKFALFTHNTSDRKEQKGNMSFFCVLQKQKQNIEQEENDRQDEQDVTGKAHM